MEYLVGTGGDPGYFNRYLKVFLKSPMIDRAKFLSHAWDRLVMCIFNGQRSARDLSSWVPAFHCLIEQGVDIHQPFRACYGSAYIRNLCAADHAFEADHIAYSWLKMLKACGVDIDRYIEIETTLIKKVGFHQSPKEGRRQLVILDFEGLPMPSWRWQLLRESKIIEVLEEFHNLGPGKMERWGHCRPSGSDDLRCWKRHSPYLGKFSFPFSVAPMDLITGLDDHRLDDPWCRETYNRAVELRDKRFSRREAKKWRKTHPREKPPSKRMPGAWVD